MYSTVKAVVLVAVALAGVQGVDERTVSGLTQMISPGSQGPYPGAAQPYAAQYWDQQPAHTPQGFTVQSGYEGIIAPTGPEHDGLSTLQKIGGVALGTSLGAGLLTHLLPFPFNKIVHFLGTKVGVWVGGFLLLLVIGGAATTAVCALTPLCTISFLGFRLNKETVRSLLSKDRLDSITEFVHNAIDKYQRIQNREGKSFGYKSENKGKKPKHPKENKGEEEVSETREKKEVKEAKEEADNKRAAKNVTEKTIKEEKELKESNELPKEDTK